MSSPRTSDWMLLKRVGRYLIGRPRLVQTFCWQQCPSCLSTFTDSDWAGDRISRKSTSGGVIQLGSHTLRSWSSTQPTIALSSGEAELYSIVKGATLSKGMMSLGLDFGMNLGTHLQTDSTAAIGIVHRKGLGRTRHINVQYLWLQEATDDPNFSLSKVSTKDNPSDILTKAVSSSTLDGHMTSLGFWWTSVRSNAALGLGLMASNHQTASTSAFC